MFQAQDGRIWSRIDLSKGLPPFEFWHIPWIPPCSSQRDSDRLAFCDPKKCCLQRHMSKSGGIERASLHKWILQSRPSTLTLSGLLPAPMSRMSSPWSISGWDNLVEVDLEGVMNGWSPMNRGKKLIQGQQGFRMFLPSDPQGLRSRLLGCVSLLCHSLHSEWFVFVYCTEFVCGACSIVWNVLSCSYKFVGTRPQRSIACLRNIILLTSTVCQQLDLWVP